MNLTELTGTTRLLLVTVVGTCSLSNSLTIWNLRFVEYNLNLFVVLKTPLQSTQVELTLTLHDGLLQFLALFQNPCRIFLTHLLDSSNEFFCICLVLSTNGTDILRIRILHEVESVGAILIHECVSCTYILQLDSTTDISGYEFVNLDTVSSGAGKNLSHTFLTATVAVGQVVTFAHLTRHNLEVLNTSDMRFVSCLEEIK